MSVHPSRPPAPATDHRELLDLAGRLGQEYAGDVAPGRVMAVVYRAHRVLVRERVAAELRLAACERLARRRLVELAHPGAA